MIRRSWMTRASIEATLELWTSSLRDVKSRIIEVAFTPLVMCDQVQLSVASAVGEGAQVVAALHAALASQSDSTPSAITPALTPPGPNTDARQSARPGNR